MAWLLCKQSRLSLVGLVALLFVAAVLIDSAANLDHDLRHLYHQSTTPPNDIARPAAIELANLAWAASVPQRPYNAVICTIVKNEAAHLEEWLTYHYLFGFDHFILYDTASTDLSKEVAQPWIDAGIVTWYDFGASGQELAVNFESSVRQSCMNGAALPAEDAGWITTIDIDEFYHHPRRPAYPLSFRPTPFHQLLSEHAAKNEAVLVVSRYEHSTSGLIDMPPAPATQMDSFVDRKWFGAGKKTVAPKIIGMQGRMKTCPNWAQHWCNPIEGWKIVNPLGQQVFSLHEAGPWVFDPLRIIHFVSRSYKHCYDRNSASYNNNPVYSRTPEEVCGAYLPSSPYYDPSIWTDDASSKGSIYNEAVRFIKSEGGFFRKPIQVDPIGLETSSADNQYGW